MPADEVIFREQQRPWAGFVLIGAASCLPAIGVYAYAMVEQLAFGRAFGDRPISDAALAIVGSATIVLATAALAVVCLARLTVEVRRDGLYVRYRPFHLRPRKIALDSVVGVRAVTYRPILHYGGWGIRWGIRGKAYNARGNRGVRLDYADGRHLLLGSQRPDELAAAIEHLQAR